MLIRFKARGGIKYTNEIIDTKNLKGENAEEIFDSWGGIFNTKGLFEDVIKPYEFNNQNLSLTYKDLEDLESSDGGTIFHQFAEILRKHIVSDKNNAFNKIFNLFICKIQDEDSKANEPNDDLLFQFKDGQTEEDLIDNLKKLYSGGLEYYIKITTPYIDKETLRGKLNEDTINEILYYRDSQDFSFKDVHNKETFLENAEVVKEVVRLLQKFKIKYSSKHQYLGDFFELLLNTGFKQEAGQYFIPVPLTRFICKCLPIKEIIDRKNNSDDNDEKLYFLPYVMDYASGSGHFITEMMDEIDIYVRNIKDKDIKGGRNAIKKFKREGLEWTGKYIYAIEKDYRLVKISKVSSFLNGDGDANVISADGLAPFSNKKYTGVLQKSEGANNNAFDILVANPPYSVSGFRNPLIKEYGDTKKLEEHFELAKYLTDQSLEIECFFVERARQLLKTQAVAGIILPISLLTNGKIHQKARIMILEHFKIKAIVSLGSNTFMATGTKTVIMFLEKRKSPFAEIERAIDDFFKTYKDVAYEGINNIFSIYVTNVYENILFEDYISIIKDEPTQEAKDTDLYKEYKDMSIEKITQLEKEKLLHFISSYSQEIVIADSGEKDMEKEFLGYEFSNRRGYEGIKIHKNEEGKLSSKLYNETFSELEDKNKLNRYILRSFRGDTNLKKEIEEIQISEEHPLKDHIHFVKLSQLMTFDNKNFDKSINLSKKKL